MIERIVLGSRLPNNNRMMAAMISISNGPGIPKPKANGANMIGILRV